MTKNASAMLSEGLRGDGRKLAEAAYEFRALHQNRERYRSALTEYLKTNWQVDANVVACSLARTKTRDALYNLVISGGGRTFSFQVKPGSRDAYNIGEVTDVGRVAARTLSEKVGR